MHQTRILVVDDDELILEMLRFTLVSEGYDVLTAENGVAAFGLLERQEVDAVLSDVTMPKMDGATLFRMLRRRYRRLPLILMSADELAAEVASDLEAVSFVHKLDGPNAILATLASVTAGRPVALA
jgi:two-component system response regulator MprA